MGVCKIILVYRRAQDMWLCVQLYISIWNNTSNNKIKILIIVFVISPLKSKHTVKIKI